MATIKAVSSKVGIGGIIDYVTKEEKTDEKLLSGKDCQPETVKDEMQATKELWGKTGGRTYKHFVQSFHKDENITPEQAHELAKQFAEQCEQFKGFEVLIATHKDREHVHTHFVLNSVSFEDGHKFQMHKSELQEMKDLSDVICSQHGLHICEKGKTFEGEEREEISAYTKETYRLLKNAEQGEVKSYVQDIALSVLECREQATSREDFIERMQEQGIGVDWQDNHKYITFTDLARQEQGEKQCKIRNNKLEKYYNLDFGKESLEIEFKTNARSTKAEQDNARERAGHTVDTEIMRPSGTSGAGTTERRLENIGAEFNDRETTRITREAERREQERRLMEEIKRRAEEEKQRAIEEAERRAEEQRIRQERIRASRKRSWDMEI